LIKLDNYITIRNQFWHHKNLNKCIALVLNHSEDGFFMISMEHQSEKDLNFTRIENIPGF